MFLGVCLLLIGSALLFLAVLNPSRKQHLEFLWVERHALLYQGMSREYVANTMDRLKAGEPLNTILQEVTQYENFIAFSRLKWRKEGTTITWGCFGKTRISNNALHTDGNSAALHSRR